MTASIKHGNDVRPTTHSLQPHVKGGMLGPVYTTVEKASGRSRMLGQDMVMRQMVDVPEKN